MSAELAVAYDGEAMGHLVAEETVEPGGRAARHFIDPLLGAVEHALRIGLLARIRRFIFALRRCVLRGGRGIWVCLVHQLDDGFIVVAERLGFWLRLLFADFAVGRAAGAQQRSGRDDRR